MAEVGAVAPPDKGGPQLSDQDGAEALGERRPCITVGRFPST